MRASWTSDDGKLGLRAFAAADLDFLDRLCSDPEALGVFEFAGISDPRARRRRFEQDGYVGAESTAVAVVLADGTVAGIASWYRRERGVSPGSCLEIGMALLPEHRGRGIGTAAHRMLVDYLLRFTTAHRLEAFTETGNVAEQKVLERAGFTREGVMRETFFRDGAWRDAVVYGLIRPGS
jgi:[ribosomal protein S5]-alanine N-acetyltransferase